MPHNQSGRKLVRATRDFTVGPLAFVVIAEGQHREVVVDGDGYFCTVTNDGKFFGRCSITDGWTIVSHLD